MIEVKELTKSFPSGRGLHDVNVTVNSGEALGFIGPNGAGKSTTIRHILGYIKADSGQVRINGYDAWTEPALAKQNVGYLPGEIEFPAGVSARVFLSLLARLRGGERPRRLGELVERFQLDLDTPISKMSKGTKQKLAVVAAFMSDPTTVILDEPSSGLDPLMQDELIRLLAEAKKEGKTILLSSHIFEEVEAVADRVSIIRDGEIVAQESVSSARSKLGNSIIVRFSTPVDPSEFRPLQVETVGSDTLKFDMGHGVSPVVRAIASREIIDLYTERQTLRDYFKNAYGFKNVYGSEEN